MERGLWMDQQQRTKRFGIFVILCACVLRITIDGGAAAADWLAEETSILFPTYSETGRNVRFSASMEVATDFARESPIPWNMEPERPRITASDVQWVEMDYDCAYRPDLEALLEQPLDWTLTGEEPTVLILHTHTTESYTKNGEHYEETARYRTLEEAYNMLSIGDAVAQILMDAGIGVIHDRQIHDYPSYNGSYVHARNATEELLKQYPSIQLILDLHRDALEHGGAQLSTKTLVAGSPSAQLMLVVGTDISHPGHRNWERNLSVALKFQALLQRQSPGIMRPLNLRAQRFNQDLCPGALLVEVGAAGNTHAEALTAARELANAVVQLAAGTQWEEHP